MLNSVHFDNDIVAVDIKINNIISDCFLPVDSEGELFQKVELSIKVQSKKTLNNEKQIKRI